MTKSELNGQQCRVDFRMSHPSTSFQMLTTFPSRMRNHGNKPLFCERSSLASRSRTGISDSRSHAIIMTSSSPSSATTPSAPVNFFSLFPSNSASIVYDMSGKAIDLVQFLSKSPSKVIVISWLRHYGCTLCMKQARDWKSWFSSNSNNDSLTVVLIGNGHVEQMQQFKDRVDWDNFTLLTDPKRVTYKALNFRKDLIATLNRSALKKVIHSFSEGNAQNWKTIPTDPFQQGGVIVLDQQRNVVMLKPDAFAGDHIERDALMQSIAKAKGEGQN